MMIKWDEIEYFDASEWGETEELDPRLVYGLDDLRRRADYPIVIHEAFAREGHAPNSFHYRGMAVDFHFAAKKGRNGKSIILPFRIQLGLILQGEWYGIGFYPYWNNPGWHLDLRPMNRSQMWIRKRDGGYFYYIR